MKSKSIYCILVVVLIGIFCSSPFAAEMEKKHQFAAQWPNHLPRAMALDTDRNFIFLGDGNFITVLSPDLELVASFSILSKGQIGGLYYDGTQKKLYAACRTQGLKVFDVSEITSPVDAGTWMPENIFEVLGLYLSNNIAYLCCGINGLIMADLSDMAAPEILSRSSLPGGYGLSYAMDVYATGDYAFAADLYNGIHVIDVTNPESPDYLKGIILAGTSNLYPRGSYLYTTLQGSGLAILDIHDPENTAVTAVYAAGDIESAVAVDGDFAWIGYDTFGLRAVDISDKSNPLHNENWIYSGSGGSSVALFPGSRTVYMADYFAGLIAIDATDKTAMKATAVFDTPADAVAIDISGDYMFAVDNVQGNAPEKEGLRILKITTQMEPNQFELTEFFELTGFCPTPGTALDVKVVREYAYVADGAHGLQIISLSALTQPVITGTCDTPGTATGLFIEDDYAFVADGESGLAVINITDKSAPVIEGTLSLEGDARHVAVYKNFAWVAAGSHGLKVIDISDASVPVLTETVSTPGEASGVFVDTFYARAFVANGAEGLSVFDITNPAQPTLLATVDTAGDAKKVMVSGNFAYVADSRNGMQVFDVSVPDAPVHAPGWSYDSPGIASDVFSGFSNENEELYAFIADGAAGVIGINLSIEKITDEDGDDGGSSSSGGCFIGRLKAED